MTHDQWLSDYFGENAMKAPKSNTSNNFQAPDGLHEAVCSMVIDCGVWTRTGQYGEKTRREVYLRFELPECLIPDGEFAGQPAAIGTRYNWSMYTKANLRQDLESWRGRKFTDSEADDFDIDTLAGVSAQLQVFTNEQGYSNINTILPSKSKHTATKVTVFDTTNPDGFADLPEWIQNKINMPTEEQQEMAKAYADEQQGRAYADEQDRTHETQVQETPEDFAQNTSDSMEDFDDDIPF